MTLRIAQPCGCTQKAAMGQERDLVCEHGNVFEKPRPTRKASAQKSKKRQAGEDSAARRKGRPQKAIARIRLEPVANRGEIEQESCLAF
jgi:hypothetical protein